jgi:hypothetical protein
MSRMNKYFVRMNDGYGIEVKARSCEAAIDFAKSVAVDGVLELATTPKEIADAISIHSVTLIET